MTGGIIKHTIWPNKRVQERTEMQNLVRDIQHVLPWQILKKEQHDTKVKNKKGENEKLKQSTLA